MELRRGSSRYALINAPEGCQHGTHTNGTAYTRGTYSRVHTQTHTDTNKLKTNTQRAPTKWGLTRGGARHKKQLFPSPQTKGGCRSPGDVQGMWRNKETPHSSPHVAGYDKESARCGEATYEQAARRRPSGGVLLR